MAQTINIAQLLAASGTVVDIAIEKIVLGGLTIGQLTLEGTSVDLASGSASLQNVRIVISLDIAFHWSVNVFFWSDSGTIDLGTLSFPLDLGNVVVPALNNIPLTIPNVVLTNLSAAMAPLTSVDLGGGAFRGVTATNLALPKNGFSLTGLGLGAVSVASLQAPEATVAKVSIQDFHPNANIVLPKATLGPLKIPGGSAASIQTTAGIGFSGIASQQSAGFSFGPVGASVSVTPSAFISIGSLMLMNVSLSASVTQAVLANIGVPIDIQGINLSMIDIGQINANNITL
jgi:hypothetical protein